MAKGQSLYDWCMENGDFGQLLLSEWTGICDDGKHYEMKSVTKGASRKKFLWKCQKGHEWYAQIKTRTYKRTNCAYCIGRKASDENNLLEWCKSSEDYGQQIIQEWTGICIDEEKHYEMSGVTKASHKKMLWRCSKGHEWYAYVSSRTSKNRTCCPYCSKVTDENSLLTWCQSNGDFGKQLMSEWTGICIDEEKHYEMTDVARTSNKQMKWKCSNGHEWYTYLSSRTFYRTNCPYCSAKEISKLYQIASLKQGENDLLTWCLNNGDFGQKLISEWTGIDHLGNHLEINEIARASNKRMKWKCSNEHEWYTSVNNRTKGNGCPFCHMYGTSYPEQFLYRALKQIYPQTISRGKYQGIEYDITIPEERTCIEYSGVYWHSNKIDRDQMKADICKQYNIRFIQIYADYDTFLDETYEDDLIIYNVNDDKDIHNKQLINILSYILKSFDKNISEIDIEKAQTEAFNFMHGIDKDKD